MEYGAPTRRWTRAEYERLIAMGFVHEDEPIELIGGELRVAEPQGSPHAAAVGLAGDALRAAFGTGWVVRIQAPIGLDPDSEPEPDVAVVAGTHRDYRVGHPERPALVVEVAESSPAADRTDKAGLYARAGIADYWIVNLVGGVVEVHRDPRPDSAAPFGWRYGRVVTLERGQAVSPLAAPAASVAAADLLP